MLSLPDGPITVMVSPTYVRPVEGEVTSRHAVGLRIMGAGEEQRERLRAYLRGLRRTPP